MFLKQMNSDFLKNKLQKASSFQMSLFAALMAFLVYSSMYAFRKPFAVATFSGESFLGLDYKVWLIFAQTLGYMASKFYGIKKISELKEQGRARLIISLIGVSALGLLGFALVKGPLGILFFVLNGFPLGLIWGIVFHFLEGRRYTEMMGAVLAASFVFSSGFVKSVGQYILQNWDVSEYWMPFLTGMVFFPLLGISVWLLNQIPAPSEEDKAMRSSRPPMQGKDRWCLWKEFKPGIILMILVYMMLTGLRDLRDNFVVEIWKGLNITADPGLLSQTEIPITLLMLGLMSLLVLVKNNKKAFFLNHWIIISGFSISILATLALQSGILPSFAWMVLVGAGVYMAYIPFNCLLFDRMIATFKSVGNVGFLMYLIDSFGYLGSSLILFAKQLGGLEQVSWLSFYTESVLMFLSISLLLMGGSFMYFQRKLKRKESSIMPELSLIN